MNFKEFAESRKSVRGFLDKPVPKELIDEIIDAAKWAPTSYNTQTWHIHAVTGDVLNKIREGNIEETMAGKPHVRDFPYKEEYEGVHRQNQIDVAVQLFVLRLLGVESGYGAMLGLSDDWAANILSQVGNYSESFEKHIGPNTPINIQRGLNALYKDGGILYAPPFR
jgi:nitroreductase